MTRAACLLLARFCAAAWIGAAALFVVNGVQEVTSPTFESATKDQLALIRFPAYYGFGFALVAGALVMTLGAGRKSLGSIRHVMIAILLAASLGLMTYDWLAVYTPMRKMLDPPGQPRTEVFRTLHVRSMSLNTIHVGLAFFAAIALCWQGPGAGTESGEMERRGA
jgi:hypothetical protein